MGYFTELPTKDIIPRESDPPRTPRRLGYIWELINSYILGDNDLIVPPAVKRSDKGLYITVDGHHRLLVADLFTKKSRVYVPLHEDDFLTEDMIPKGTGFLLDDLNSIIKRIFGLAEKISYVNEGTTFSDIRQEEGFWFLRDIESARRFYTAWKPLFGPLISK